MCITRLNSNYTSPVICERCYYRCFSAISKRKWTVCPFNLGSVGKYARRGDSKSQARSYRYSRWCVNNLLKYKLVFFNYFAAVFDIALSVCLSAPCRPNRSLQDLTTWYIRGRFLLFFKVGGQRSRLYCHIVGKRCRQDTE